MSIGWSERPKQKASMDYKSPDAKREYALWGSTVKTDILLAIAGIAPLFDTGIDATTQQPITLFRGKIELEEAGGGCWTAAVNYESSQSTVELSFTLGVQSTKIQQALKDVSSYNCVTAVSAATTTAANSAITQELTVLADIRTVATDAATATADATAATTAANAAGVAAAVKTDVLACVTSISAVVVDSITASAAANNTITAADACANAAGGGDTATAATNLTAAQNYFNILSAASAQATTDSAAAATASTTANTDAAGGNAATLAAAASAASAAAAAATLATDILTLKTDCQTLLTLAGSASTAAAADQAPGGNGVPDFKGAIGVGTDGNVEGVEIEVGKVEFSITKKWQSGSLSASYINTLSDMLARTVVNGATFVFIWMGQTLSFPKGSLRFRGFPIKWSNSGELEITYYLAYERPILAADAFKVGQSASITKEGWQYMWTRFGGAVSVGTSVAQPKDAHIVQVYPYDDFSKLSIQGPP